MKLSKFSIFEKFDKNEIFVSKSNKVSSEISFKQKWHSKLEWSSSSASWKKGSNVKLDTKNRPTKINKEFLVNKLSEIQSIGHFLRTPNGYKVTAPEGFVAVDRAAGAVKLVDRLEFSRANFTAEKDWVKG